MTALRLKLRICLAAALAGLLLPIGVLPTYAASGRRPNPPVKAGYHLDFQEEFNDPTLNTDKWLPYYLPHWAADREKTKADYTLADGKLNLRLGAGSVPWNPAYDGTVKVSSIQSYEKDWWHRFRGSMPLDHHEPDFNGYSTKYGYFEIRARMSAVGGGGHEAFWLVGTDDTTGSSANPEIDMIETRFSQPSTWRIASSTWSDPDFQVSGDPALTVPSGSPTTEYHTYGMEWTPTQLKFYYDNQLFRTLDDAPNMPMGMILGIYTDASTGPANAVWPKEWSVDYIRVYKPDAGYPSVNELGLYRLKNRNTGEYMHIEDGNGTVQLSKTIPASAWSSQWYQVDYNGYRRFRNRQTGDYLNAEAPLPRVQYGPVRDDWWSAQWSLVRNGTVTRLQNRARRDYLHNEDQLGYVQEGGVQPAWWSADWTLERITN